MANLTVIEKQKLEKLFEMSSGYVLDFSQRSYGEFFVDSVGVDIFAPKYNYNSGSKANRMRAFWGLEDNQIVGKLLLTLLEYWKNGKNLNNLPISPVEAGLYNECIKIAKRLLIDKPSTYQTDQEIQNLQKKDREKSKETQLGLLLQEFDQLATSTDHQNRGFLLESLLNKLFLLHNIPVVESFRRNSGGEQIDGAFTFDSWHYLVECKWTQKLADHTQLDSLLGKIKRSGRQTMGLFLSIEGWSKNVPDLLKQNPDKCILLMEGVDLRYILCGAVELEELLRAKLAKLNLEAEPYYSAVNLANRA